MGETSPLVDRLDGISPSVEKLEEAGFVNADAFEYFVDPEFPDAIVGVTASSRVAYSREKIIEALMQHSDMDCEEAEDYLDYNIIGALPPDDGSGPVVLDTI